MATNPSYAKVKRSKSAKQTALDFVARRSGTFFFPIAPGTKDQPLVKDWANTGCTNDPNVIRAWPDDVNVGLVPGKSKLIPVDIDTKPGKVGAASLSALELGHGPLPPTYTVRTASGGEHRYYEETDAVRYRLRPNAFGKDIDCPPYAVIAGSVTTGGNYTVIDDAPIAAAPTYLAEYLQERTTATVGDNGAPASDLDTDATIALATAYLKELASSPRIENAKGEQTNGPAIEGQQGDNWTVRVANRVGDLGITAETCFELMRDHFNDACIPPWPLEGAKSLREKIQSAYRSRQSPLGIGTPEADFANDPPEPVANDNDPDGTTGKPEPPRVYDGGYDGDGLESTDFPKQKEIIAGILLKGTAQSFDADGGIGKSLICAQMAVHRAAGKPFLGREVEQGGAIFITHEDPYHIVKERMQATAAYLKLPNGLRGLPLRVICILDDDLTIAKIDDIGGWKRGPYYDTLDALMASMPGALIFLDCRSDFAEGDFVTSRSVPNTFYKRVLNGLARKHGDATPVAINHPSKASMSDGSWSEGTTGNRTAIRRQIIMKLANKDDQDGPRWFGPLKNNYGPRDRLLKVVFRNGIFVLDTDPNLSAETVELYERVVAKVVSLIRSGLTVVKFNQADGHGPEAIARAMKEDEDDGIAPTEKEVKAALEWGERKSRLRYIRAKDRVKAHYEIVQPGTEAAADFRADPI